MEGIAPISLSRTAQRGMTLTELLVALVIMSIVMAGSGLAFQRSSPRFALETVKAQLMSDLKRARQHARENGEPIIVLPRQDGYLIEALSVPRRLPRRIHIQWPDYDDEHGVLVPIFGASTDLQFVVDAGSFKATIIVERLTGRIYAL